MQRCLALSAQILLLAAPMALFIGCSEESSAPTEAAATGSEATESVEVPMNEDVIIGSREGLGDDAVKLVIYFDPMGVGPTVVSYDQVLNQAFLDRTPDREWSDDPAFIAWVADTYLPASQMTWGMIKWCQTHPDEPRCKRKAND